MSCFEKELLFKENCGFISLELSTSTINKLLTALNECTEWGQVFILDSLSNYTPRDDREAQSICERITPRLAHANAAVVLSAVKVLIKMMEILQVINTTTRSETELHFFDVSGRRGVLQHFKQKVGSSFGHSIEF